MKVFGLMGLLCGISACISTARLNAATNAAGTLDELYVIASAVIGGTSLAGGIGTIAGAMLGALVMQSLQSGMVLLGVDTPLQNIVVGAVLVAGGLGRQPLSPPHQVRIERIDANERNGASRRDAQHLASPSAASRPSTASPSISSRRGGRPARP